MERLIQPALCVKIKVYYYTIRFSLLLFTPRPVCLVQGISYNNKKKTEAGNNTSPLGAGRGRGKRAPPWTQRTLAVLLIYNGWLDWIINTPRCTATKKTQTVSLLRQQLDCGTSPGIDGIVLFKTSPVPPPLCIPLSFQPLSGEPSD